LDNNCCFNNYYWGNYLFIFKPEARPWYPDYNLNSNINSGVLPNVNEATNQPTANTNASSGLPGVDNIAKGGYTETSLVESDTRDVVLTDSNGFAYYDQDTGGLYRFSSRF